MTLLLELNLTMPQLRTLQTIYQLGQVSGRQLARELNISPASVVPLCDRLEEQGYIERVRDTDDRRIWWFRLTPAGAEAMEGLLTTARSRVVPAIAKLSRSDRKHLVRLLDTLTAALAADEGVSDAR